MRQHLVLTDVHLTSYPKKIKMNSYNAIQHVATYGSCLVKRFYFKIQYKMHQSSTSTWPTNISKQKWNNTDVKCQIPILVAWLNQDDISYYTSITVF